MQLNFSSLFFVLFIISSSFINNTFASDYFFKRISIEQGLSHPGVNSILRDKDGILWIGTRRGLNRMNRNDLKIFFHNDDNYSISGNYIYNLNEDDFRNLWIATEGGLSLYDREKDEFYTKIPVRIQAIANIKSGVLFGGYTAIYFYSYETKEIDRLPLKNNDTNPGISDKDYFISHLIPLNNTQILVGTEGDGIFTYNLETHDFTPLIIKDVTPLQSLFYDEKNNIIYVSVFQKGLFEYNLNGELKKSYTTSNSNLSNDIILDIERHNNKIWLATDGGGINILNNKTREIENVQHTPGDINSLPVNSITVLYNDANNNLWAGSVRDGIFLFKDTYIRTYKDVALGSNKGLSARAVISLFEDKSNNLWIGTDGGGINMFDSKTDTFTHHLNTYGDKVVSMTDFSDTELLISLYGKGVFIYNIKTQNYKPFLIVDEETNRQECFSGFVPICHRITPEKILILSKNAYIYNTQTQQFNVLNYETGLVNIHSLQFLYTDNERILMTKGNTIYILENKENIIRQFVTLGGNEYVTSACYNRSTNLLWIASSTGLKCYDTNSKKLEKIETNLFSHISYMYLDTENRLWINASNMLFSYEIKNKKMTIWDDSDGFLLNEILTLYVKPSQSGYIFMGGSNGLVKINKKISTDNDFPISLSLLDVELNGEVYSRNTISKFRRPKIPENYSSLKIRIDINEKDLFRHILFRYRINNQNNSYTVESYSNVLDLVSLALGKSDIYVSCMTKSGNWTDEVNLITFVVIPPWYKRTWFVLLLVSFILGLIILSIFMWFRRNKRKLEWEMAMHTQELNEDKIQFLTNVCHELRTPLTLIYAPLKRMLENQQWNPDQKKQLKNIFHQTDLMKDIINWILDYDRYSKLSDDLKLSLIDLNELIRSTIRYFEQEFYERNISIRFESDEQIEPVEIDESKIRVVISNLLMNALKFSTPYTDVIVKSNLRDDFLRIEIKDHGIGFKKENMDKIFTRFYQGEHNQKGSGIGLAYCKQLIEKHNGYIGVLNDEVGATLYFELPYKTALEKTTPFQLASNQLFKTPSRHEFNFVKNIDLSQYVVLIVDDNRKFIEFLENELKPLFKRVLKAENGVEALTKLKNNLPDILVSDVMMPIMNGYQLCKNVKENIEISHIPIVLLTAKNDEESQKVGYKSGADFYLSKPFDIELLLFVIQNQLKNKEIIKRKYQNNNFPIPPEQYTISNADEQFMKRLDKIIKEYYSDPDFNVSSIVYNMAMSRASLYSKMKEITGIGINNYINKYRIFVASSLLTETNKSISDIAFETGFTSQRYFNAVFKQIMNETPSGYREKNKF